MERVIPGDGLVLRIWQRDDRDALALILDLSQEAFGEWLPGAANDLTDPDAFLNQVESAFREGSSFFYAIEEDGKAIGQCSFHDRGGGTAEIGYWVRTDRTGRGIATRAVMALVGAALDEGVCELVIHCDEGNVRSAAVARKAGFVHAATVQLDGNRAGTRSQTGREMRWTRPGRAPDD